jgi:hypothetical protein
MINYNAGMQTVSMKIQNIDTLIKVRPPEDERLAASIRTCGILQPPIVCQSILCDGHRRLNALKKAGATEVTCIEAAGSPALLFAQLNSHRELSTFELASAFAGAKPDERSAFFAACAISESPQLVFALEYINNRFLQTDAMPASEMPMNTWRELAHLGTEIDRFAPALLEMPGTVSEKRNIAMLLRQAQRKNSLPAKLDGNNAAEILASLQTIAQPRRSAALARFNAALQQNPLPPGVSVKIDPTFAIPGMQLSINLNRRNCERLLLTKLSVEAIFKAVEEL